MSKNDFIAGGQSPAFPVAAHKHLPPTLDVFGLTLRDFFAAKAMEGLIVGKGADGEPPLLIARWAYVQADAMLEEREK